MYLIVTLYILPLILLTTFVEIEYFGWATTSMLAFAGVMAFLHRHDLLPYIQNHGIELVTYISIYIIAGIAWSFAKWTIFLLHFRNEFRAAKFEFQTKNNLCTFEPIPIERMHHSGCVFGGVGNYFEDHLAKINKNFLLKRPLASDNKSKIIAWMSFWPCSIIGFILNDPIRKMFKFIFNALRGSYQKISDSIVNDSEFENKKE